VVEPRILHLPHSLPYEQVRELEISKHALDLWADCGIELDDWQEYVTLNSLVPNPETQKWAALEVGLDVSRQNGKGGIIEARLAVEVDIIKSALSLYSAHLYDTSMEAFRRFVSIVEGSSRLRNQLKVKGRNTGILRSHGEEGLEFKGDRRVRFRTRSKGGGRGWTVDGLLVFDEAMVLPEQAVTAIGPTMSGKSMVGNPQILYAGSAVDQEIHEHGIVFARVRERGLKGEDPNLAWFEWSIEGESPDLLLPKVLMDRAAWAQANPALGIRIDPDFVAKEMALLGPRGFAVERLGVGDWPRTDHVATNPLDFESWMALGDEGGVIQDPQVVVYDVSPERKAAVVVGGRRKDGLAQGELVESKGGTAWVASRVAAIAKKQRIPVVCDGRGPASSLVPELRDMGVEVQLLTSTEHSQACGHLVDGVARQAFRHLDDPELNVAVRAAVTRPLGDAWAWSRKDSSTNIAPLVAFTLAVSHVMTAEKPRKVAYAWA
jgi:hypothetical protein